MAPIPLGRRQAALTNVVAWAAIHSLTGYAVHRLPIDVLRRDVALLRPRAWEPAVYERLGIRRWKDRLPEAGALYRGGLSKRHLPSRSTAGLERFAVETRRAELGHWLAAATGPVTVLWNPPLGAVLSVGYGLAINAPFIAIQRYNRARVLGVLARRAADAERSRGTRSDGAAARSRTRGSSIP